MLPEFEAVVLYISELQIGEKTPIKLCLWPSSHLCFVLRFFRHTKTVAGKFSGKWSSARAGPRNGNSIVGPEQNLKFKHFVLRRIQNYSMQKNARKSFYKALNGE